MTLSRTAVLGLFALTAAAALPAAAQYSDPYENSYSDPYANPFGQTTVPGAQTVEVVDTRNPQGRPVVAFTMNYMREPVDAPDPRFMALIQAVYASV